MSKKLKVIIKERIKEKEITNQIIHTQNNTLIR